MDIVSELFRINQWASNEYGEKYAVLDNDIEIRVFQSARDKMVLQGMFGEPIQSSSVANASEIKLRYLLQANFIRIVQYNDVLSIDKNAHRLTTTRHISLLESSTGKVLDEVESFIQNVDFWDMALKRKQSFATMSPLLKFSLK
ncbi:MAG: type III secretion system chaperone [Puniceicoccales bacterium]|nr:type III secretion system chaperone [Puniceicoccales bacterium]